MANHVHFDINMDKEVDEDKVFKYQDRTVRGHKFKELVEAYDQPFMSNVEKTLDEDGWLKDSYSWHIDNIGAKWVNLDYADESTLSGYSAWSPPIEMLGHFAKFIKQDLKMTYEDEFRNFIGVAWSDDEGNTSYEELADDDVLQLFLDKTDMEELPDDYDWWEEEVDVDGSMWNARELYDECVYEWLGSQ